MAKRTEQTDQPAGLAAEDMIEIAEWVKRRIASPAAQDADPARTAALIDVMFAGEELDDIDHMASSRLN